MSKKKIIRAETMGYCMGVRRAIKLTNEILESDTPRPIYTLGPLIHNRNVLEELEQKGIHVAEDTADINEGTVIIRAHGVTPDVLEELRRKNVRIIDATCTRVIASMKHAREYSDRGYHVVLVGDALHGEIQAIAGYAKSYSVIELNGDYPDLDFPDKTVIIGQTTLREKDYKAVCRALQKRFPRIEIIDSICPATEKRQESLQVLIDQVEAVIVAGGKNSANTTRLFETAKRQLSTTWHVETAEDLPDNIGEFDVVGITAGASTPDWIIDSIEKRIRSLW